MPRHGLWTVEIKRGRSALSADVEALAWLASLVLINLPFAMVGRVCALIAWGLYLSVPASVGFIVLFGIAVLNGLVLVSYISQLRSE